MSCKNVAPAFIPEKYLAGSTTPDGTTKQECKICQREFAIPSDEVDEYKDVSVCECVECIEGYMKELQSEELATMQKNSPEADLITKAIGNK